jgi:hypothetical protein
VVAAVRAYLPDYNKGYIDTYEKLSSKMDGAITRAEQLAAHNKQSATDNPATSLHHLVKYLRKLKNVP